MQAKDYDKAVFVIQMCEKYKMIEVGEHIGGVEAGLVAHTTAYYK